MYSLIIKTKVPFDAAASNGTLFFLFHPEKEEAIIKC
jgi:hypothetical protein